MSKLSNLEHDCTLCGELLKQEREKNKELTKLLNQWTKINIETSCIDVIKLRVKTKNIIY